MDFKTLIDIVELGLKAVALLAAGIWAFALYKLLKKRELAEVSLRKSQSEVRDLDLKAKHVEAQIRELDLKAKQQAVVSVEITPTVHKNQIDSGYLIIALVQLTNSGGRNTRIKWRDELPAFTVRFAKFDAEGGKRVYELVEECRVTLTLDPNQEPISHVIRAGGGQERISFAVRVSSPGAYLLSFRGAVDERERAEAEALGAELPLAWTGNRYVFVGNADGCTGSESTPCDANGQN